MQDNKFSRKINGRSAMFFRYPENIAEFAKGLGTADRGDNGERLYFFPLNDRMCEEGEKCCSFGGSWTIEGKRN